MMVIPAFWTSASTIAVNSERSFFFHMGMQYCLHNLTKVTICNVERHHCEACKHISHKNCTIDRCWISNSHLINLYMLHCGV